MSYPPDDSFVDYYQLLGVDPEADWATVEKEIKQQQRKWRARTTLSDLNRRQEAERMMAQLADARKTLGDPARRAAHDRKRASRPRQPTTAAPAGAADAYDPLERAEEALRTNDYNRAMLFAEEASRATNSARAWNLRARAYAGEGDGRRAAVAAQESVGLEPDNPMYHIDLGIIHQVLDEPSSAIAAFEKASQLAPEEIGPRLLAASVHLDTEQFHAAVELLDRLHREHPDDREVRDMLAAALVTQAEAVPQDRDADSYVITSKQEIDAMRPLVERAARLGARDPEVRSAISGVREYLARQERKVLDIRALRRLPLSADRVGCLLLLLVVTVFLSPLHAAVGAFAAFGAGDPETGVLLLVVAALLGWAWWAYMVVPRWKQNLRDRRHLRSLSQ
ncbi:tetratricopeptide repeat protein [Thermobifida halotolerans]|uniref:Tetratricopeptide repeat protein n=1 Tax=Thermobifida halotolerans TaxID=483545 RepID=A0A399FW66_9ACTN|nr:tetratricopeptide repeat protein [Thermobifida halotolerans]UOE18911.1 tetratricopeptide repeat protein [Thermobifida halotolerans]